MSQLYGYLGKGSVFVEGECRRRLLKFVIFLVENTESKKHGVQPGMATPTIISNDLQGTYLLPVFQLLTSTSLEALADKGRIYLLEDTVMIPWECKSKDYI